MGAMGLKRLLSFLSGQLLTPSRRSRRFLISPDPLRVAAAVAPSLTQYGGPYQAGDRKIPGARPLGQERQTL